MGIVYSGRRESPDAVIVLREGAVTRLRHLGGPSSRSMAAGSSTGPGFSIQMPSVPLPPPPGVQEPSVTASNEQSSGGVREVSGDDQKAGALLSSLTVVNDDDFEAERGVRRLERPRFELEPKHALLCIMVLVCALATTLTLLGAAGRQHGRLGHAGHHKRVISYDGHGIAIRPGFDAFHGCTGAVAIGIRQQAGHLGEHQHGRRGTTAGDQGNRTGDGREDHRIPHPAWRLRQSRRLGECAGHRHEDRREAETMGMRAMTAPACDREHRGIAGSRDLRMLPVAAGVWSATLLTRWVCSQHGSGHDVFWQHGRMLQMACLAVASAAIFIALVLIPLTMNGAGKHHGLAVDRAHRMLYTLLTVCFAILAATLATAARSLTEHADPVNMSASSSTERVNLTFTAHSLPLATSMGGYDCQVDGNARSIVRHDVRRPSSRGVRVFARQPACGRIAQQGDYAIVGTIQAAAYGEMPIWVLADGDMMAVKEPPAPWRAVHRIRMAFLQTTRGLDESGRCVGSRRDPGGARTRCDGALRRWWSGGRIRRTPARAGVAVQASCISWPYPEAITPSSAHW